MIITGAVVCNGRMGIAYLVDRFACVLEEVGKLWELGKNLGHKKPGGVELDKIEDPPQEKTC
jgi:hypothetical protein